MRPQISSIILLYRNLILSFYELIILFCSSWTLCVCSSRTDLTIKKILLSEYFCCKYLMFYLLIARWWPFPKDWDPNWFYRNKTGIVSEFIIFKNILCKLVKLLESCFWCVEDFNLIYFFYFIFGNISLALKNLGICK